jgi:hypothetical protein
MRPSFPENIIGYGDAFVNIQLMVEPPRQIPVMRY